MASGKPGAVHPARHGASRQASVVFCRKIFECGIVEHRLRQHSLQPCILVLKRSQLLRIGHIHAAKFGLVFVERRVADAVFPAKVLSLHPGLVFLDNSDNLLIAESAFHGPSFPLDRSLTPQWPEFRGLGQPVRTLPSGFQYICSVIRRALGISKVLYMGAKQPFNE